MVLSMSFYNSTQFSKLIGVTNATLLKWDKEGKLVADRNPSGRRVYTEEHIQLYLGKVIKGVKKE